MLLKVGGRFQILQNGIGGGAMAGATTGNLFSKFGNYKFSSGLSANCHVQ